MSGGSYNYMYSNPSPEGLMQNQELIREAAEALEKLPYAKEAAQDTRRVADMLNLDSISTALENSDLLKVWRALEWWDSGDWGEEALKDECTNYKNRPQIAATYQPIKLSDIVEQRETEGVRKVMAILDLANEGELGSINPYIRAQISQWETDHPDDQLFYRLHYLWVGEDLDDKAILAWLREQGL